MQKIDLIDVGCKRSSQYVFASLSLSVKAGEKICVSGPNGSGKTSLLYLLSGILPLHEGKIKIDGQNSKGHGLFHSTFLCDLKSGLKPDLTVWENLDYCRALEKSKTNKQTIEEALMAFNIKELWDKSVRQLSSGQLKKTSLARLLLINKAIWLLDEPEVNLDLSGTKALKKAIDDHVENGGMAIIATHNSKIWNGRDFKLELGGRE